MEREHRRPHWIWTAEQDDTLLPFLLSHVTGKSRNNIKSMLARGQVAVDGRTVTRFDTPVPVGSKVRVAAHQEEPKIALPFPILYEDEDLLVIDKPAGLLTIANEKERFRTAYRMNGFLDYLPFIADCERGVGNPKKAIELAMSDDAKYLRGEAKAEMFLVYAGALGDLEMWDKAVEYWKTLKTDDDAVFDKEVLEWQI